MVISEDDKLYDKMKKANEKLDQIQKGLNDYLEVKRLAFSRFFFLSNDELLEILSQTKDPAAVQPFLKKCFEGINKVSFAKDEAGGRPDDLTITHIISAQGEKLKLTNEVDPNKGENKGNAEIWLGLIENSMRITVKDIYKEAKASYPGIIYNRKGFHAGDKDHPGDMGLPLGSKEGDIYAPRPRARSGCCRGRARSCSTWTHCTGPSRSRPRSGGRSSWSTCCKG